MEQILGQMRDELHLTQEQFQKLRNLSSQLEENGYFEAQSGPYPARHGKGHICQVLKTLMDILPTSEGRPTERSREFMELAAAAMIHDVGMVRMKMVVGDEVWRVREEHSDPTVIVELAAPLLKASLFTANERENIIEIAQAHAGDRTHSADEKMAAIEKASRQYPKRKHLRAAAALLRVADFFDIGQDRLCPDAENIPWDEGQVAHLKKHRFLRAEVDRETHTAGLKVCEPTLDADSQECLEKIAILREVYEDAKAALDLIDQSAERWEVHLNLATLDEELIGSVWPVTIGVRLFGRELEHALESASSDKPIQVDMMGHSLYGRFVLNAEELNEQLLSRFGDRIGSMRVLLLDPSVETQQMCEVLEAQKATGEERDRAIVSPEATKGDILESIAKLRDWAAETRGKEFRLEVRITRRLMYMSIARFGERMIVTHYRGKWLSKKSPSYVLTPQCPLFDVYENEFEAIWQSPLETEVSLHQHLPIPDKCEVLDRFFSRRTSPLPVVPLLDYERAIEQLKPRLGELLENQRVLPPFEVEIQTSSECNLRCSHCIGAHLTRPGQSRQELARARLNSILDYEVDDFRVNRFRISGLSGETLSGSGRDITFDFLRNAKQHKREVVVFTNGVELDSKAREELLQADYVHVSLDAGTPDTFASIKGRDAFEKVVDNLREFSRLRTTRESDARLGIGFVVTRQNAHEIREAVEIAAKVEADFIRFKPDIRGLAAFSWRTWKMAETKIREMAVAQRPGLEIACTSVPWHQYHIPEGGRCWAQFYFACVGPDGEVYSCDHLSGSGRQTALGDLVHDDFSQIWENAVHSGRLGTTYGECSLCPPFNWRLNRLFEQLEVLYQSYGWQQLEAWINKATQ